MVFFRFMGPAWCQIYAIFGCKTTRITNPKHLQTPPRPLEASRGLDSYAVADFGPILAIWP